MDAAITFKYSRGPTIQVIVGSKAQLDVPKGLRVSADFFELLQAEDAPVSASIKRALAALEDENVGRRRAGLRPLRTLLPRHLPRAKTTTEGIYPRPPLVLDGKVVKTTLQRQVPRVVTEVKAGDPIAAVVDAYVKWKSVRVALSTARSYAKQVKRILQDIEEPSPTADLVLTWFAGVRRNVDDGDLKQSYFRRLGATVIDYAKWRAKNDGRADGFDDEFLETVKSLLSNYQSEDEMDDTREKALSTEERLALYAEAERSYGERFAFWLKLTYEVAARVEATLGLKMEHFRERGVVVLPREKKRRNAKAYMSDDLWDEFERIFAGHTGYLFTVGPSDERMAYKTADRWLKECASRSGVLLTRQRVYSHLLKVTRITDLLSVCGGDLGAVAALTRTSASTIMKHYNRLTATSLAAKAKAFNDKLTGRKDEPPAVVSETTLPKRATRPSEQDGEADE